MQVSNDLEKAGIFLKVGGAAYVNGIMNGEGVKKWKKEGGTIHVFKIRW
jgi:predicted butyrate kinase (DUF1464 family)